MMLQHFVTYSLLQDCVTRQWVAE